MVRGGGGQKNDMAGYEDFVYILGRGKTKLDSFFFFFFFLGGGGHFYAILDPVLSSMYKIQNGDSLGIAKISFLFIYLFLNWKCDKFDMLNLKPCTDGSTGFPRPWRITKGLEVRFEGTSLLPFYCKKQASIIRKYHDQTLNTIPRHHEGEPQNIYISKTSARQ